MDKMRYLNMKSSVKWRGFILQMEVERINDKFFLDSSNLKVKRIPNTKHWRELNGNAW